MTDVVFAFGPDGYFFESQTQWRMKDLPQRLAARFAPGSSDVAHVHHLVLGAGESWFMSYRTRAGGASFAHDGLPEKLAAWLRVKDANGYSVRNIPKLRISLGPYNASFWAEDGKEYFWDNLPGPLQIALEKLKSPVGGWARAPKIVVLGVNQSYVMMSEGGGGSYAVSDYYPWLEKELLALVKSGRPGALKLIHHISIDQHDGQNFVLTTVDGQVYYYVPDSLSADLNAVRVTIPRTPASGFPIGREAETGSNPMPIPQAVFVPSSGLDISRSPEEAFAQAPLTGAFQSTGAHFVHSNLPSLTAPNSIDLSQGPAPPYSSNSAHGHSTDGQVGHEQTSGQNGAISVNRRTSSPQSLYQHPRVTALENAAATTRIDSPVPSMSQSQYSHSVLQYNLDGMAQRIMSPVPAAAAEQAIVAHSSSDIVSPKPEHQHPASVSVVSGGSSVSPRPATISTGPLSGASVPLSSSPTAQTGLTATGVVHNHHGQEQSNQPPGQQIQDSIQQGPAHVQSISAASSAAPTQNAAGQFASPPGQSTQSPTSLLGGGLSGTSDNMSAALVTASQANSPPPVSPPPVPNPTPIQYNVQIAGSPGSSSAAAHASQVSPHSPVPVVHSPGTTPSGVDSVPVPTTSTPGPQLDSSQQSVQLVSIPVRQVIPSQTTISGQTSPAEISASPPPHRQSVTSSASFGTSANNHFATGYLPVRSDDATALPGAVPFMPPSISSSPAQMATSPPMSPTPLQPRLVQTAPTPAPQQVITSPLMQPQLMQGLAVSMHTQSQMVQGHPQLVRIVSSPGSPQQFSTSAPITVPGSVGSSGAISQQSQQPVTGVTATQTVPQASALAPTQATQPDNKQASHPESAQQKKKPQPASQGQKLATAFGIGLARGAVKAFIS